MSFGLWMLLFLGSIAYLLGGLQTLLLTFAVVSFIAMVFKFLAT